MPARHAGYRRFPRICRPSQAYMTDDYRHQIRGHLRAPEDRGGLLSAHSLE